MRRSKLQSGKKVTGSGGQAMPPRGWDVVTVYMVFLPWKQQSTFKTSFKISAKTEHLRRMFSKSTVCLYFKCCGFRFRFYRVYSIEQRGEETFWGIQSLKICIFPKKTRHSWRNSMFFLPLQVTFFCFLEEMFSAEMIQALPPVLCHWHRFVTFFVGGLVYCLLQNTSQSTVLYYPFLFPSVKLLNVDVRRNESLLLITIF